MSSDDLRGRSQIHGLLKDCAHGLKDATTTGQAIINFSTSETAPDAHILSDLLLDTLFLYDSGVSCDDETVLNSQREHLGELVVKLIVSLLLRALPGSTNASQDGGCIVEQDAYERLEAPLLFAANLIPDAKAFERKHIRINTNLLYKQQKFNLFREDNEGYSKLVVEVDSFLSTVENVAVGSVARELLTNVQSLIGYFDLDPNRVLDVLVELFATRLLTHWRFIILVLKLSPWFFSDEPADAPSQEAAGNLESSLGNHAAAQIIGFKFQQFKQSPNGDRGLIMLAALLIKEGLLKLQDLWPHLAPDEDTLAKEKSSYQTRILDEVDKAKGRNALAVSPETMSANSAGKTDVLDVWWARRGAVQGHLRP